MFGMRDGGGRLREVTNHVSVKKKFSFISESE